MEIEINTLIIGAGYSGLIVHKHLTEYGVKSIVVERGYSHARAGGDYVIFTKNEYDFTSHQVTYNVSKISSGTKDFDSEYAKKVYGKDIKIETFDEKGYGGDGGDGGSDSGYDGVGYAISSGALLNDACVYGNIVIKRICVSTLTVYGEVLHIKTPVIFRCKKIISTIPMYKFAKLIGVKLFDKYNIFISYFPIGIKRKVATRNNNSMLIEYFSDPLIPFYRKQHFGNVIFYEYCLNKPIGERFDSVIAPGKFTPVNKMNINHFIDSMAKHNIHFAVRYALWDPDFLLDHLVPVCGVEYKKHLWLTKLYEA